MHEVDFNFGRAYNLQSDEHLYREYYTQCTLHMHVHTNVFMDHCQIEMLLAKKEQRRTGVKEQKSNLTTAAAKNLTTNHNETNLIHSN